MGPHNNIIPSVREFLRAGSFADSPHGFTGVSPVPRLLRSRWRSFANPINGRVHLEEDKCPASDSSSRSTRRRTSSCNSTVLVAVRTRNLLLMYQGELTPRWNTYRRRERGREGQTKPEILIGDRVVDTETANPTGMWNETKRRKYHFRKAGQSKWRGKKGLRKMAITTGKNLLRHFKGFLNFQPDMNV